MDDHERREIRRQGSNRSNGSSDSSSSNDKVARNVASTIDFIQNFKPDNIPVREQSNEDDVPSYTRSALVERKPIAANLRHLESESQRSSAQHNSLPSLTSSASSTRGGYSRSESDGRLDNETRKRRRLSSDADSSVLTPLYQAVSAGASLDVIQSLVQSDPSSVGRRNGGGLTPLHCAIERYDTPVSVLMFLLESRPSTAAQKCMRGFTPIDLLWKRYVEPDSYRSDEVKERAARLRGSMEQATNVDMEGPQSDEVTGTVAEWRQARANIFLQDVPELRSFWGMITMFIYAACHGTTRMADDARVRLVHDAVSMHCSPILVRFCAALFPHELMEQEEVTGQTPLHIAAETGSQENLRALLELEPRAVTLANADGKFPLHLAIQAQLSWEGALDRLVAAWPHSLTIVDPTTGLLPAMVATDCSTDVIFNLLYANPVEVCRFALERTSIE